MQRISPYLWFDHQAEEAANFYTSIFKNSRITGVTRQPPGGRGPEGSVLTVSFELEGTEFVALNGGPEFQFTEAVSFYVSCQDQQEVDELWRRLTADGGEEGPCGWLKDKYGLSWQIIPTALPRLMSDPDPAKVQRVMQAMFTMKKLDVATLERASQQA